MSKSIRVTKKQRGRPKTTGIGVQIGMRWQSPELALIDSWIKRNAADLSRPDAIRRLVELGLKATTPKKGRPDQTIRDSDGRVIPSPPKTRV